MKKLLLSLASVAMVLGTTVAPAHAQWWGNPYYGGYGWGHRHHSNWARNLGWGLGGLAVGAALGSALGRRGYYNDYYGGTYPVYTAPVTTGYYGNYWY